jgi:formate hydrogenlyase transcriptional activator
MISEHKHFITNVIRFLSRFASGFLLYLLLFIAVFCLFSAAAAEINSRTSTRLANPLIDLTTEEQAWLAGHPDIVLGASTDYQPMVIRKADGAYVGVLVDLFEQISRVLDSRIRLHIEDSWADIQQKAQNRVIDGLAFGGRDPSREALYNPTDIVLTTYFSVFARSKNEFRLTSFSDLGGMRIGYKRAARPTRSLLEKLPASTIPKPYDNHESMTQALLNREIDVIVAWMSYDHWRKDKMQGTIDNILLINEYPIEMVTHIRKDWPELIAILNKAIAAIKQDGLPRIVDKWFGDWPGKLDIPKIDLTKKEQTWLKAHPDIKFGFTDAFEPYLIVDKYGKNSGVLIDILNTLNQRLGTQFEVVIDPWPTMLEKVKNKESAGILGIASETAEANGLLKTESTFSVYPAFYIRKNAPFSITNLDDIVGKSVAILKSAKVMENILEPYKDEVTILKYDSNLEPLQMLFEEKVDLAFGLTTQSYFIAKYSMIGIEAAYTLLDRPTQVVIGVRPDLPELVPILNKGLAIFTEDEINAILAKWILLPEQPRQIELTPEEQAWLAENHNIRVTFSDHAPYFYLKDGKVVGLSVDFLNTISEISGIKFQHENKLHQWTDELKGIEEHTGPDLLTAIRSTPEREKVILFTEPYINSPRFIFTRDDAPFVSSIENLSGKKVAVVKDYAIHDYFVENHPNLDLVVVNTVEEALRAVSSGKAFAVLGDMVSFPFLINGFGLKNIKAACPSGLPDHPLAIGIRNDWPELRAILNKALEAIPADKEAAIINNWSTVKVDYGISPKDVWTWILSAIGATSGIVFLFVFWNRQLHRTVLERTSELSESESRFRATFEQAAVGVAHVSLEGSFLRVNRKFCDIVGYSIDEMLDLTFQDITHPDDLSADLEHVEQIFKRDIENYTMEKRYCRKDDIVVWVNLTVSLVCDKDGNPEYFVSVIKDISDRKKIEKSLQQSYGFLDHLTTTVPDAVFSIKMPERLIEWANDSYGILGYEASECVGGSTAMFYPSPEEYQRVGAFLDDIIRQGKNVMLTEGLLRRKNGEVFEAEINISVYREQNDVIRLTSLVRDVSETKQAAKELQHAYGEIKQLQKRLEAESFYLQEEIKLEHNFENIIGQSEGLKYVLHRVEQVAPLDSTVLILGETGTGKELIARALHKLSSRNNRPLVKVNCAALPGELIESELFGHEKGAFTGATTVQIGRFELANESTLFLDEIGELPLELQAKLLRVIESGEFERLGSSRTMESDARIIAATNRNLEEEVRNNRFREDLLYRLKIFPITIPPLRDRVDDIPLLVNKFVHFFSRKMGKQNTFSITSNTMQLLQSYHWPGNVRELMHVTEGALISSKGKKLSFELPKTIDTPADKFKSFHEMEREYILSVLKAKNWKIGGNDGAAFILGMPPSTLRSRVNKLGLKRP